MIGRTALLAAALAAPALAQAQNYPSKPVRVILTVLGGFDAAARLIGQKMSESMGQPLVIEVQSGAGGSVGAEAVSRAAPDGYTILLATTSPLVLRPFLSKNVRYDTLKDFTPIVQLGDAVACLIVNPSLPVNSVRELVEYMKRNPGKLSYGTSGVGTTHHLSGELVTLLTGAQWVHVPYKGGAESLTDIVAGRIPALFGVLATSAPHVASGKLKLLAINADRRYAKYPDVPTMGEQLPGYEKPPAWFGFLGPAGLPQPVVRRFHEEAVKSVGHADVRAKFDDLGLAIDIVGPEEFPARLKRNMEHAGKIVKAAGLKPE
jgi:tripartite-type tricarboxylate transporter receptor subunit TctC